MIAVQKEFLFPEVAPARPDFKLLTQTGYFFCYTCGRITEPDERLGEVGMMVCKHSDCHSPKLAWNAPVK